jgi:hypothetical protein
MDKKRVTYDSQQRQKFVEALVNLVTDIDNEGFTPDDFSTYLATHGIMPKSKKDNRTPDPRNDLLTTIQKAAQDYGICFYYHGVRGKKLYYVDDRTAKCAKLRGRKPSGAVYHSGSQRGFARRIRKPKEKQLDVEDFFRSIRQTVNEPEADEFDFDDIFDPSLDDDFDNPDDCIRCEGEGTNDVGDGLNQPYIGLITQEGDDTTLDDTTLDDTTMGDTTMGDTTMDDTTTSIEEESSRREQTNYPYPHCIPNDQSSLVRYSYEGNFYFVSTFLLQENLVASQDELTDITPESLKRYRRDIQELWKRRKVRDKIHEEDAIVHYFKAADTSFMLPLQLPLSSLERYWRMCGYFHDKARSQNYIMKNLSSLVPSQR